MPLKDNFGDNFGDRLRDRLRPSYNHKAPLHATVFVAGLLGFAGPAAFLAMEGAMIVAYLASSATAIIAALISYGVWHGLSMHQRPSILRGVMGGIIILVISMQTLGLLLALLTDIDDTQSLGMDAGWVVYVYVQFIGIAVGLLPAVISGGALGFWAQNVHRRTVTFTPPEGAGLDQNR